MHLPFLAFSRPTQTASAPVALLEGVRPVRSMSAPLAGEFSAARSLCGSVQWKSAEVLPRPYS